MDPLTVYFLCFWLSFGFVGAIIGQAKGAGASGFWLGFLLGPIGLIAAIFVDHRKGCPHCGGKVNGQPSICMHCRKSIAWPKPEDQQAIDLNAQVKFACTNCNAVLSRKSYEVGRRYQCGHCKHDGIVPELITSKSRSLENRDFSARLTTCSDCGASVSKRAAACPRCGGPIAAGSSQ